MRASEKLSFHHLFTFLCAAIASMLLCVGCDSGKKRLHPFGWERLGGPIDSLTLDLEDIFLNHLSNDSANSVMSRLVAEVKAHPGDPRYALRHDYWETRMLFRTAPHEIADSASRALLAATDSAAFPYEYRRIRLLTLPDDFGFSFDLYKIYVDDAEYYESIGELTYCAKACMEIGHLLNRIEDFSRAEQYMCRADSLLKLAGQHQLVSGNRINHAAILYNLNEDDEVVAIIHDILADTIYPPAPINEANLYLDLYIVLGDTASLTKAYEMAKEYGFSPDIEAQYESYNAEKLLNRGLKAEALAESRRSVSHEDWVYEDGFNPQIYRVHAVVLNANGLNEEAFKWQQKADSIQLEMTIQTQAENVLYNEHKSEISKYGLELNARKSKSRRIWIAVTVLAVVALAIVIWIARRKLKTHRAAREEAALSKEQTERQLMAMQLTMQEHNTLLSTMEREVSKLSKKGDIDSGAASRLGSTLKAHNSTNDERDAFQETFGRLHPRFVQNLKEKYPDFTESDIKMASYIVLGMDSHHIARIMGIRPESVKQARWRMRGKMNLPKGADLKNALAALNE